MTIFKFDDFAKVFCICAALYVYIFILSNFLRLNPNDDGDEAFIGMIFGFLPMLTTIVLIIFDWVKGVSDRIIIKILFFLLGGMTLYLTVILVTSFREGFSEFGLFFSNFYPVGIYVDLATPHISFL